MVIKHNYLFTQPSSTGKCISEYVLAWLMSNVLQFQGEEEVKTWRPAQELWLKITSRHITMQSKGSWPCDFGLFGAAFSEAWNHEMQRQRLEMFSYKFQNKITFVKYRINYWDPEFLFLTKIICFVTWRKKKKYLQ